MKNYKTRARNHYIEPLHKDKNLAEISSTLASMLDMLASFNMRCKIKKTNFALFIKIHIIV